MSTIQVLIGDINSLLSDSKRRFSEIRNGCETAVKHLQNYNQTMPIQNIKNELDKQIIIKPFILACKSGNIKLTNTATPVIYKLILAHAIPEENIPELLQALLEASNLAIDIQLRILQCLPAFMQVYTFTGSNLLDLLSICSSLTANNKSPIVSNAASATLQQLFTNIYDSIGVPQAPESERTNEITIDDDVTIKVDNPSFEGYRIFLDLCHLLDSESPEFLTESIHIKFLSLLEIIENIIHGHQKLFQDHQELAFLLRTKVFPTLLKFLNSTTKSFPLIDRTMRIIHVLLATQLQNLTIEGEIALSYFSHLLLDDPESASNDPVWEKVIVLEMFKNLFSDFLVIRTIFEKYDYSKGNKNVLKELFTVFTVYLQKNDHLVKDVVEPMSRAPSSGDGSISGLYLSRTKSNIKPLILDHLDKTNPPTEIPATYPIYLIYQIVVSFAEGVALFVYNVYDETKDAATLEADIELANSLVKESTVDVSLLYEMYIYSSMDDETFLTLIKSFQKLTHATGLLGLTAERDRLLLILSKATIKNVGKTDNIPHPETSLLQGQKKQLLAFGEQLVESISSTITGEETNQNSNSHTSAPVLHSRYFNSRHVVCLRVLSSIAMTLKSTLQESWSIVWITFQWCNYFLEGPDQFSGFSNHKSYQNFTKSMLPQISAQDVETINNSKNRLYESLGDSLVDVFRILLGSLTELSDCAFKGIEGKTELPVALYNKTYFLNELVHICDVDKNQWLINDDESWDIVSSYFIKLGSDRNLAFNLRGYIVETYTKVIEFTAVAGFKEDSLVNKTSQRTLNGLNRFLDSLIEMGVPQELLIINCETDIHLKVLTRLHDLIDKYDKNYQLSWKDVFKILNSPFKTVVGESGSSFSSDKVQLLIEKSFDTIKLILDEFMSTLPFDQFKLLIDTLANFVYQKHDLNISFSSVSYFWLISDSLKSRMVMFNSEKGKSKPDLKSEEDLVKFIEDQHESYASYICLDIYLLLSLAKISNVEVDRAQVRDGAIQTFYQIIDVHGKLLNNSWDLIYEVVLPNFFNIIPESREKDWLESLQLILSGFVSLYSKFMMNGELEGIVDKWKELFSYFEKLFKLQWIDLNLRIFKSLQDLMNSFNIQKNTDIRQLFFDLWSQFPIEYDLVNNNYQDSLVQFMNCFPPLYKIIKDDLSVKEVDIIVGLLNKCGMYPILPGNQSDNEKLTNLQNSILNNLKIIDVENIDIQSLVIQQLSNMIVYPFGIRNRISKKLQNIELIKSKLPTFIGISHLSLGLLSERLKNIADFSKLIQDNAISKCMKSLLETTESRSVGISTRKVPLWIESNDLLVIIITKLINQDQIEINQELWKLIVQSIELSITSDENNQDLNIDHYNQLTELVIPKLLKSQNNNGLIKEIVEKLYENSYLYKPFDFEMRLMEGTDINVIIDNLTLYKFNDYYGTTQKIEPYSNLKIRMNCLQELIKFLQIQDGDNLKMNEISENYLLLRSSFTLRRIINDIKLLYKCPLPIIQQKELLIILNGINNIELVNSSNKSEFKKLYRLLIQLIPYSSRVPGLNNILPQVLIKISM